MQKKCIIGGGSSFIDSLNLDMLHNNPDIFVIGCNHWGLHFKTDLAIMQDAWMMPAFAMKLTEKGNKLCLKDYSLHEEIRSKADLLFVESEKIEQKEDTLKLFCGRSVALGAIQLALHQGFNEILCVGVDYTEKYSKKWNNEALFEFKQKEIDQFTNRIAFLRKYFNFKIYNANIGHRLQMQYKDFYEFLAE